MSTGLSCTVLLDGQRVADGSPGDDLLGPVALDELKVSWGRADTMSQPSPDTCSFEVMDQLGGDAFMTEFRTGRRIDVLARGESFPDPSLPTFLNPSFELPLVTWSATGGTAERTEHRAATGTFALALTPNVAGVSTSVLLAPGELQADGTAPDAWAGIPTTRVGQVWEASVSLWLPPGATAAVRAAMFTGPYASAATIAGTARGVDGTGAWVTVSTTFTLQVDDRWVGLYVELSPTGPTWVELPPALTWDALDPTLTWVDAGAMYIDDADVTSPAEGTGRTVLVFSGRITDMAAGWDNDLGAPVVEVTALGFTADLDNRKVGDEPWTVETVAVRAERILELAGLPVGIEIDTTVDEILLTYRDVDSQGAAGLLAEIASSVDGVLWHAVHLSLGAYLRLEDPSLRAALLELELVSGVVTIVQTDPDAGVDLSACEILRDPVTWIQDVADVATRVEVTWLVQGVDEEGNPVTTESTVLLVDAELELELGTRAVSLSTQLQAAEDAVDVAQRLMSRAAPTGWRAEGLTIHDEDVREGVEGVALMLGLLDGTSRIGMPLVLSDLPTWSPSGAETAGVYLEGGTYTFTEGRWVLDLTVSASGGGLGASVTWAELDPTWRWVDFDPGISWSDLRGVAA